MTHNGNPLTRMMKWGEIDSCWDLSEDGHAIKKYWRAGTIAGVAPSNIRPKEYSYDAEMKNKRVHDIIKSRRFVTNDELSRILGVTVKTSQRRLNSLYEKGEVQYGLMVQGKKRYKIYFLSGTLQPEKYRYRDYEGDLEYVVYMAIKYNTENGEGITRARLESAIEGKFGKTVIYHALTDLIDCGFVSFYDTDWSSAIGRHCYYRYYTANPINEDDLKMVCKKRYYVEEYENVSI